MCSDFCILLLIVADIFAGVRAPMQPPPPGPPGGSLPLSGPMQPPPGMPPGSLPPPGMTGMYCLQLTASKISFCISDTVKPLCFGCWPLYCLVLKIATLLNYHSFRCSRWLLKFVSGQWNNAQRFCRTTLWFRCSHAETLTCHNVINIKSFTRARG